MRGPPVSSTFTSDAGEVTVEPLDPDEARLRARRALATIAALVPLVDRAEVCEALGYLPYVGHERTSNHGRWRAVTRRAMWETT